MGPSGCLTRTCAPRCCPALRERSVSAGAVARPPGGGRGPSPALRVAHASGVPLPPGTGEAVAVLEAGLWGSVARSSLGSESRELWVSWFPGCPSQAAWPAWRAAASRRGHGHCTSRPESTHHVLTVPGDVPDGDLSLPSSRRGPTAHEALGSGCVRRGEGAAAVLPHAARMMVRGGLPLPWWVRAPRTHVFPPHPGRDPPAAESMSTKCSNGPPGSRNWGFGFSGRFVCF